MVLAVGLQAAFICVDSQKTAAGTAILFSKAYFALDPDMDRYLSHDLRSQADGALVADFIYAKTEDTRLRGFETGMAKRTLVHINAQTLATNGTAATVLVKGTSRTCINPVFAQVARLFRLGETYSFEETLTLVKENGQWKISGAPYDLPAFPLSVPPRLAACEPSVSL